MITLLWMACAEPPPPAPAPVAPAAAPAPPTADSAALAEANRLIDEASQRLQARMIQSMKQHGPSDAAETCSIEASALTESVVGGQVGARVGRASLRLRNPGNAGPDWVQTWLDRQGERTGGGVVGFERIEPTPNGPVARVVRPIVVGPQCLTCHGPKETLAADVRAVLERQYPDDGAVGYALGDLRGAMWAEVPVGAP